MEQLATTRARVTIEAPVPRDIDALLEVAGLSYRR
jgi:hypothetical protein